MKGAHIRPNVRGRATHLWVSSVRGAGGGDRGGHVAMWRDVRVAFSRRLIRRESAVIRRPIRIHA